LIYKWIRMKSAIAVVDDKAKSERKRCQQEFTLNAKSDDLSRDIFFIYKISFKQKHTLSNNALST
jgi:hypothetical protein